MKKFFKHLATPYIVWLCILAILPMFAMLLLSFINSEGFDFSNANFTFSNFAQLGEKSTLVALGNSFLYSILTTVICIVVGYIVAFTLYRSHIKNKFLILMVLVLPMWSNILLRVKAMKNILDGSNVVFSFFENVFSWHINFSINWLPAKVLIGLTSIYLPFMIMSIYNALEKIEPQLEEAALDLGLTHSQKFWKVILPLSAKGIFTGSVMIFLPCFSSFAIPDILGDGNIVFIGNIIEQLFDNMNYNIGSLLAILVLIMIMGLIILVSKVDKEGETLL